MVGSLGENSLGLLTLLIRSLFLWLLYFKKTAMCLGCGEGRKPLFAEYSSVFYREPNLSAVRVPFIKLGPTQART